MKSLFHTLFKSIYFILCLFVLTPAASGFAGKELPLSAADTATISTPLGLFVQTHAHAPPGKGAYKEVYRVSREGETASDYALSIFSKIPPDPIKMSFYEHREHQDKYRAAWYELQILSQIEEHKAGKQVPGLIPLAGTHYDPVTGTMVLVTPFYNLGDLNRYLVKQSYKDQEKRPVLDQANDSDEPLKPEEISALAKQLLTGLAFLHKNGIVHRDIKLANIVLRKAGTQYEAALIDFGTAYNQNQLGILSRLSKEFFIKTSDYYAAPELIEKFHLRSFSQQAKEVIIHNWSELISKQLFGDIAAEVLKAGMRWNPDWTVFQSDEASDNWAMGVSLLELTTELGYRAISWAKLSEEQKANIKSDPLSLPVEHFLGVTQDRVDRVLNQVRQLRPSVEFEPVHSALACLITVNPVERCTAERALKFFERSRKRSRSKSSGR